ncbi:MAG: DoxX family protein [Bacteroidetes bacterium]|nr:DoxX family protein [Bacteroidota bacterium]
MTTSVNNSSKSGLNIILQILRVLLGALFIFSAIVKANDPSGLANKMTEFFEPAVLDIPWLIPHSLAFSILLISSEFVLGVTLLIGFAWRFFSWLMLGINLFFTFLTAYIYYWDVIRHSAKVRECGCFGDCIPISNSETFWKDVILLAIAILLFIFRKRIRPLFPKYPNTAVFILSIFFVLGVQWWAMEHLPFHDCMPYKVGTNICEGMKAPSTCIQDSVEMVFVYKHNGKLEDVTMDRIGEIDSTWEYVDRKDKIVRKGNGLCDPPIKDFVIRDYAGNDFTQAMLDEPGYKFLLFLKDPEHARKDNIETLRALSVAAQAKNIPIYILSSGSKEANAEWQKWAALSSSEIYGFDQVASKTAMRTDPGLMLVQGCVIRGKWSFRDYPKSLEAAGIK